MTNDGKNEHNFPSPRPQEQGIGESQGEMWLLISFRLRETCAWAPEGFEVASGQVQVQCASPLSQIIRDLEAPLEVPKGTSIMNKRYLIETAQSRWVFDTQRGQLISWRKKIEERIMGQDEVLDAGNGKDAEGRCTDNMLASPPLLTFYRALTDNDRPQDGRDWVNSRLHEVKHHVIGFELDNDKEEKTVTITTESRYAPLVFEWSIDVSTTYIFRLNSLEIKVKGKPRGLRLPPTLARIGLEFEIPGGDHGLEKVTYWGRGPGEGYRDLKGAQRMGVWHLNAAGEAGPILAQELTDERKLVAENRMAGVPDDFVVFCGNGSISSDEDEGEDDDGEAIDMKEELSQELRELKVAGMETRYQSVLNEATGKTDVHRTQEGQAANEIGESAVKGALEQRPDKVDTIGEPGYTAYEWPQDCGNRTDVRWVEFSNCYLNLTPSSPDQSRVSLKASFGDIEGASFSAQHYKTEDLDKAEHHYELARKRQKNVVVRLDWTHHGIGSGSCGPRAGNGYRLETGEFEYCVLLQ